MSPRIFKYPFSIVDGQTISTHAGCYTAFKAPKVLRVGFDPRGTPCLWAEVDADSDPKSVSLALRVFGTGHPLSEDRGFYVGSLDDGEFVWHVYYRIIS